MFGNPHKNDISVKFSLTSNEGDREVTNSDDYFINTYFAE
jgi:hypothetical protein